jgi:hypothetical protein
MEHVENLLKATLAKLTPAQHPDSRRQPITIEGHTIIPLVAIGFCFGGGGGSGKQPKTLNMEGLGAGSGGGGGVDRPPSSSSTRMACAWAVQVPQPWSRRSVGRSARSSTGGLKNRLGP